MASITQDMMLRLESLNCISKKSTIMYKNISQTVL